MITFTRSWMARLHDKVIYNLLNISKKLCVWDSATVFYTVVLMKALVWSDSFQQLWDLNIRDFLATVKQVQRWIPCIENNNLCCW